MFARSAFLVSLGSVISFIVGALSQLVIAAVFGAGLEMDAFFTSTVVPTFMAAVMLSGINFVLIPAIIDEQESGKQDDAWALVGTAMNFTFVIFVVIAILIAITAPQIVRLIAPDMGMDKQSLTSALLRIQIFALPLMAIGSMAAGVRNTQNYFLQPALAHGIGSLGNIIIILAMHRTIGIFSLAWGWTASYFTVAMFNQMPIMRRCMANFLPLRDPRIIELGFLILPFILFGILQRSLPIFERYYASGLPDGQLSYLGYASNISKLMMVIIGSGISTGIFPAMARQLNQGGRAALAYLTERGLTLTISVAIPITLFFVLAGFQFVDVFLGRGRFDLATSNAVGSIVGFAAVVVTLNMLGNLLGRSFYVIKKTWITPLIGSGSVLLYIVLASYLSKSMQYRGLVIAQVIATGFSVSVMTAILMHILRVKFIRFWKTLSLLTVIAVIVGYSIRFTLSNSPTMSPIVTITLSFMSILAPFTLFLYLYDRSIFVAALELFGITRIKDLTLRVYSSMVL
jgi:putative peptidoglycan lipid II flippase